METCHYCGNRYHPMPVYTKAGSRINVCHMRLGDDYRLVETDCRQQAERDGYIYRPDLTPKR